MNNSTNPTADVPALRMVDLSVDFAVDGVWRPAATKLNYTIARGEVVAVVGESGSGKSVSSMAILDLLPKSARIRGDIEVRGRSVIGLSARRLRALRGGEVAAIFQEPMTALNPVYTIGFQIVETVRIHSSLSPAEARARAIEMLRLVELPDPEKAFNSYPHQLSGGQRQRAMIAQALVLDPELLIADEPTTALDVTVQAEILELLRGLKDRLHSAVLLITHDMGVVADLADRVVVMQRGEIVEQGTTAEIFSSAQHPYTQALLAAVPHLGQGATEDDALPGDDVAALSRAVQGGTEQEAVTFEAVRDPVLTMDGVVIEYGARGRIGAFRAVDEVSLQIERGEVLGLVGESGSGKTTIGRAAIGLQPITDGRLNIAGVDLSTMSRRTVAQLRRKVGIVFQDPAGSLNPRLPIGQSIGEPLLLAGEAKGRELDRRVQGLLDSVRLPTDYRNRFPHELSGGQKQRVGIARALALSPQLLIADEPTSALDVSVQVTVLELLKTLQREQGFACLFISHDLAVIDQMADRIAVLNRGRIVETGSRDAVLRSPRDPYTQRLVAAIPVPDPEEQRRRREVRRALLRPDDAA